MEQKPHSSRWFWEYGWLGPGVSEDGQDDPLFAAAKELGFEFVYGGAIRDKGEWEGYPAEFERARARIKELEEQFETLRNFAESCCEIIERSRNPVEEIAGRLDDVREIAYGERTRA